MFNYVNLIDLVLGVFSIFLEDAPYFVRQSPIRYLLSIQLSLVISSLLVISLNNPISVHKGLSCLDLIEYTKSYN